MRFSSLSSTNAHCANENGPVAFLNHPYVPRGEPKVLFCWPSRLSADMTTATCGQWGSVVVQAMSKVIKPYASHGRPEWHQRQNSK